MKTSELTGPALDWAVAKCEGREVKAWAVHRRLGRCDYSTNWAQGGPIIERERVTLMYCEGEYIAGTNPECFDNQVFMYHKHYGPTPLIAAMRCYVASRLGEEVDVPEELQ